MCHIKYTHNKHNVWFFDHETKRKKLINALHNAFDCSRKEQLRNICWKIIILQYDYSEF